MAKLLAIIAVLLLSCALVVAQELEKPPPANLIQAQGPWSDTGFVQNEQDYRGVSQKVESGERSGVAYRFYYTDGSGSFAGEPGNTLHFEERNNWNVACDKDPISDARRCYMYLRDLWISVYGDGRVVVSVYRTWVDDTWSVFGFSEGFQYISWAVKQIR